MHALASRLRRRPALRRPRRRALSPSQRRTLVLMMVLVVSTSACGLLTPRTVEFAIGTCVLLPDTDEITEYEEVGCEEVHDAEVYALPQHSALEEAPYPGGPAIDELAEQRCREEFGDYVGLPYDESELHATFLRPSQDSWEAAGDREIVCLIVGEPVEGAAVADAADAPIDGVSSAGEYGQLTGSMRGAAR